MSYSRDLAFDAALDAQRRDEARDYSEEDFVDLDTPDCECRANEPLCEAIMEKARSYSVDDIYPARAYKRAAEKIASLTVSVFALTEKQRRLLGVGPRTNWFIYNWIMRATPESLPVVLLDVMVPTFRCFRTVMTASVMSLFSVLFPKGDKKLLEALMSIGHELHATSYSVIQEIPHSDRLNQMFKNKLARMDAYDAAIELMDDLTTFLVAYNQGDISRRFDRTLSGYKADLERLKAQRK